MLTFYSRSKNFFSTIRTFFHFFFSHRLFCKRINNLWYRNLYKEININSKIKKAETKEVKKTLAGDYVATGRFILVEKVKEEKPKYELPKRKEEK